MEQQAASIAMPKGYTVIIDAADHEWLSAYRWYYSRGYARRSVQVKGKVTSFKMHREIMNATPGSQVDHINGNRLDNRRCNLRFATKEQQRRNSGKTRLGRCQSVHKGVSLRRDGRLNPWRSAIYVSGKKIWLGSFKTEESAAMAYNCAALRYFGEFARLNVIAEAGGQ